MDNYTHPRAGVSFLLHSMSQLPGLCFPGEWCLGAERHTFETRLPHIGHEDKYITTLVMWNLSLTKSTSSGSPNQSLLVIRKQSLQIRLLLDLIRKLNLSQPHHYIGYSRLCHVSTTPYLIQDFCWFTTLKGALFLQLIHLSWAT